MQKFIKKNWLKVSLLIIVIVIGSTFYWLQWKPKQIREQCYAEAEFDKRVMIELNETTRQQFIDNYYIDCLRRFGLEK